jgi:C-terminal processing protease CtpA/Prc
METSQFSDYFICLNDDETEFCIENFKLIKNLTIYRPVTKDLVNTNGNSGNLNTVEGELNTKIQNKEASPINSSTPLKTKSIQESQNKGMEIEEIKIIKINGAMGLSIVGGGSVPCHPFGVNEPGIFISKIAPDGAASKTNLRIGDRILRVNNVDIIGASHDETVDELKRFTTQVSQKLFFMNISINCQILGDANCSTRPSTKWFNGDSSNKITNRGNIGNTYSRWNRK